MSIVDPEIDVLLNQVQSKYTLCTVAAKRSRQITDMINGRVNQGLSAMAVAEVAKLTGEKPLSTAMAEIAAGDVAKVSPEAVAQAEEEAAAAAAAAEATSEEDANAALDAAVDAAMAEFDPLPDQAETDALPAVEELLGDELLG
ncbi:MAG: DNA-directed RNA polymerase subunit omega [Actinomycetes bacterium]|jgi:DNA-directed RNA polymerase subunit omega|nr:DNA-directed RNA polymerase subunit omega [Actinomycetes bacterium]